MYDGYEYGNTRLRARMAQLLDEAAYDALLGRPPEVLLAQLADTAYAETVEEASARFSGLQAVYYAIRHGLASSLQAARSFYAGAARQVLDQLANRWDLFNLRTLVRGLARRASPEAMLELLVPAGSLPESVLRELVGLESVRALFDRLATWRLPFPGVVPALLDAAVAHDRSGDTVALEQALQHAFARSRDAALRRIAHGDSALAVLRWEVDVTNLLVALRVAAARARGESATDSPAAPLPGGRLPLSLLQEVSATAERDREETRALLERSAMPESWRPALAAWAAGGSLQALARSLDAAVTRRALALRRTGDPLGPAIPVAFVFARENEARNLRRIAAGAAQSLDPTEVRPHLVVPS